MNYSELAKSGEKSKDNLYKINQQSNRHEKAKQKFELILRQTSNKLDLSYAVRQK